MGYLSVLFAINLRLPADQLPFERYFGRLGLAEKLWCSIEAPTVFPDDFLGIVVELVSELLSLLLDLLVRLLKLLHLLIQLVGFVNVGHALVALLVNLLRDVLVLIEYLDLLLVV